MVIWSHVQIPTFVAGGETLRLQDRIPSLVFCSLFSYIFHLYVQFFFSFFKFGINTVAIQNVNSFFFLVFLFTIITIANIANAQKKKQKKTKNKKKKKKTKSKQISIMCVSWIHHFTFGYWQGAGVENKLVLKIGKKRTVFIFKKNVRNPLAGQIPRYYFDLSQHENIQLLVTVPNPHKKIK